MLQASTWVLMCMCTTSTCVHTYFTFRLGIGLFYTGALYDELHLLWMVENGTGNTKPPLRPRAKWAVACSGKLLWCAKQPPLPVTEETGSIVLAPSTDLSLLQPLPGRGPGCLQQLWTLLRPLLPAAAGGVFNPSLAAGIESHAPLLSLSGPTESVSFRRPPHLLPTSILGAARPLLVLERREERQTLGHRNGGGLERRPHQGAAWRKGRRKGGRGLTWWGREMPLTTHSS